MMYRPVRTPDGHERRDGYHRSCHVIWQSRELFSELFSLFGTIPTLDSLNRTPVASAVWGWENLNVIPFIFVPLPICTSLNQFIRGIGEDVWTKIT